MTTAPATSPPWQSEARQWARFVLDAPEDFDAAQPHQLLLARLKEAEFVPVAQWEEAGRMLVDDEFAPQPDQDLGYPFFFAFEGRLHGVMSQFVADFFQLAPDERRKKWEFLSERSKFAPALRWHLGHLKPGLDATLPADPTGDKYVDELIDHLRRTFPLPPPLRAAYNQAFLWRVAREPKPWPKAVKRLQRRHPSLTALQPEFFNQIGNRSKSAPTAAKPMPRPTTLGSGTDTPKWIIWVLVFVGIAIARSASNWNSSPRTPPVRVPNYKPYQPPQDTWPSPAPKEFKLPPGMERDFEYSVEEGKVKVRPRRTPLPVTPLPATPPPTTPLLPAERPEPFDPRKLRIEPGPGSGGALRNPGAANVAGALRVPSTVTAHNVSLLPPGGGT